MSLFTKSEKETVLILDIGNGSIGGSLAELHDRGIPKIFYSHREPITIEAVQDSKKLLESMKRLLGKVLESIHAKGIRHPNFNIHGKARIHDIFCVFSSPWYISQTKTIKIDKAKPFSVSKRFVEDIVDNEERIFRDSLAKGHYGHIFEGPARVIEHNVIETKLNGYGVDSPYGKSASTLEISLFTSIVAEEIIAIVEGEVHKHFNYKSCKFFSFSLVSFSTIRDLYPHDQDFMFLDITGEVTDMSITRKNVLLETISFPLGRASLIRKLSETMKVSPQIALSYVRMHSEQGLSPEATMRVARAQEGFKREWCEYFKKALLELSRDVAIPKKIFFTADRDAADFFQALMVQEACIQFPGNDAVSNETFDVNYIAIEKLKPFVDVAVGIERDEFTALEAIFFNKLFTGDKK